LDIGDWLTVAVTSTIAGIGAAMGWFSASNKKRDDAIEGVRKDVEDCKKLLAAHATQLAVSQACQENISEKLGEIKEDISRTAEAGAHSVNTQMAQVLNEVQKLASAAQQREHRS